MIDQAPTTITGVIAAGAERIFDIKGLFVACVGSTHETFRLSVGQGAFGEWRKGYQSTQQPFERVTVKNTNATPLTVELLYGGGGFRDARQVVAPNVFAPNDLDDVKAHSFIRARGMGGVAANYTYAQVWNPVGSDKLVAIRSITLSAAAAGPLLGNFYNTALGSVDGNFKSVYSGQPDGAAEYRFTNSAAWLVPAQEAYAIDVQASDGSPKDLLAPLILEPGKGFIVGIFALNIQITVGFEATERPLP